MVLTEKELSFVTKLFPNAPALLSDSEKQLQEDTSVFIRTCKRRNLRINVGENKVISTERRKVTPGRIMLDKNVRSCR